MQSARNVKRNSDQIVDAIVAAGYRQAPRHRRFRYRRAHPRHPGDPRSRRSRPRSRPRPRPQFLHDDLQQPRDFHCGDALGCAPGFPVGCDFGARGIQDVYGQPDRTGNRRRDQCSLAPALRLQGLRGRRFASGCCVRARPAIGRPTANLLITDRWKVGDEGEFGALLDFSYTNMHYQDSISSNAYFVAPSLGPTGLRAPDWPFIEYNEAHRYRPSLNGAIQYRAEPRPRILCRGPVAGFPPAYRGSRISSSRCGAGKPTPTSNRATARPISSRAGRCSILTEAKAGRAARATRPNTYQFAGGGSWDHGPLRVTADLARTNSTFTGDTESVDWVFAGVTGQ